MVKKPKERDLDLGHTLLVQNALKGVFVNDPNTIEKAN